MAKLDPLIDECLAGDYYTADGVRVMIPLSTLIVLGLVSPEYQDKLKKKLDENS